MSCSGALIKDAEVRRPKPTAKPSQHGKWWRYDNDCRTAGVDTENVAQVLKSVCVELTQSADPVVLDFFDVRRIDPAGLRAFEDLAAAADQKAECGCLQGAQAGSAGGKVLLRTLTVDMQTCRRACVARHRQFRPIAFQYSHRVPSCVTAAGRKWQLTPPGNRRTQFSGEFADGTCERGGGLAIGRPPAGDGASARSAL